MSKKNIKDKFTNEVSTRHREKNKDVLKQTRETKRKRILSEDVNIVEMIQQLPIVSDKLEHLNRILGSGKKAEPYFAPSALYPEYAKGPFIFPTDDGIHKLIALFNEGNFKAGECLLHISAHGEVRTWTFKLVHYGLVPILIRHLHQCADFNIRALCYWIIANMCTDNMETRDLFVSIPEYFTSFGKQTEFEVIEQACWAFKTLFEHSPIPPIDLIAPLWTRYFGHVKLAIEDGSVLNDALLRMVLKGNAPYRIWIATQHPEIIERMIEDPIFLYAMSQTPETHPVLIQHKVGAKFLGFLHQINPETRVRAAYGLTNLIATHPLQFYEPYILKMIGDLISQCDIWKVQRQLYFALTEMALATDSYGLLVENGFIYHLYTIMAVDDTNLLINALRSLRRLLMWDQGNTSAAFEELDGVSRLETLGGRNQNPEIQELVENLIDMYFE